MKKCKACGRRFRLKKENKYLVEKTTQNFLCRSIETNTTYECFDCPACGCQNICNVREVNGLVIGGDTNDSK